MTKHPRLDARVCVCVCVNSDNGGDILSRLTGKNKIDSPSRSIHYF